MAMSKKEGRVATSWLILGSAAELPLTRGAVEYAHKQFYKEILDVDEAKFIILRRVIGFVGAKARRCAKLQGHDEITKQDFKAAVNEVSLVMRELAPHFRSICYCAEDKGS